jgi:hypothetical protein
VPVSDSIFNCHDFSLGLGLIGLLFIGEADLFLDFVEKFVQGLRSVGAVTKTTFGERIVNCAILLTASVAFAGTENAYSKSTPAPMPTPGPEQGDFGMMLRHSKRIFEKSVFRS